MMLLVNRLASLLLIFVALLWSSAIADERRMLLGRNQSTGESIPPIINRHYNQHHYPDPLPSPPIQARSPVSYSRSKECPVGFELQGKQCVSTEVIPFDYVCPAGTVIVNEECASFKMADRVCPPGSHHAGDVCIQTSKVPVQYQCVEGNIMGNICQVTAEVEGHCPAGFELLKGECARFVPHQLTCSEAHYNLENELCVRRDSYSASPSCPSGFSLTTSNSNKCEKTIYATAKCPFEYTQVHSGCVKEVQRVAAPCPEGYTLFGESCQRVDEYPIEQYCPEDFEMTSNLQCRRETPVAPTCAAGFTRGSKGTCERPAARVPVCSSHERLTTDSSSGEAICTATEQFPPSIECPTGYTLIHDKCKRVMRSLPTAKCSVGTLTGGRCVTQSTSTPLVQCPAGYNMAKGQRCIREIPYDCPRTVSRTECEMPNFVSEIERTRSLAASVKSSLSSSSSSGAVVDYKHKSQHNNNNNHHHISSSPVLEAVSSKSGSGKSENKEPTCQLITTTIPQTCTRTESAAVEQVCPDGRFPVGKSCVTSIESEPEYVCPSGSMDKDTGDCVEFAIVETAQKCPEGTSMNSIRGTCETIISRPADEVCPQGTTFSETGNCVHVREEIVHPARVEIREPLQKCIYGEQQGNRCFSTSSVPVKFICPSGSEESGLTNVSSGVACIVSQPLVIPPPLVMTMEPEWVCHDGSSAHGRICHIVEAIPAEQVCTNGLIQNNRCKITAEFILPPPLISRRPANPYCPEGYLLNQHHECVYQHQEQAARICPADYIAFEHNGYECIKAHARIPVCPAGSSKTENGCLRKSYTPPQVTEIKQCTKGTPGC